MDPFEHALRDFFDNQYQESLLLHNSYGEPEEMPVEIFFRDPSEMPEIELYALSLCKGKVLDIGAGAGCHSLFLQDNGLDVTALEISKTAIDIISERGVRNVIHENVMTLRDVKFDTLLLLMNGIGLTGNLEGLTHFLNDAKNLLEPAGQLLFDSSDINYLYEEDIPLPAGYYGEISYQYEYNGVKGNWFNWIYIDQNKLAEIAQAAGWVVNIVYEDDMDHYLARLVLAN